MTRFWRRRDEVGRLERELRPYRPQPSDSFVAALAERVRESAERRPARAFCLGLAGALTAALLAALAGTGGLGYAASTVRAIAKATNVTHAVSGQESTRSRPSEDDNPGTSEDGDESGSDDDDGPAEDQYKEQRRACKRAVKDAHKAFHLTNPSRAAHKAYHKTVVKPAKKACRQIGR